LKLCSVFHCAATCVQWILPPQQCSRLSNSGHERERGVSGPVCEVGVCTCRFRHLMFGVAQTASWQPAHPENTNSGKYPASTTVYQNNYSSKTVDTRGCVLDDTGANAYGMRIYSDLRWITDLRYDDKAREGMHEANSSSAMTLRYRWTTISELGFATFIYSRRGVWFRTGAGSCTS
jgi:hypothetical protein